MKASKKKHVLPSLVAILAMAIALSACGNGQVNRGNGTSETASSVHGQTTGDGGTGGATTLVYNQTNKKDGTNEAAFSVYSLTNGKSSTSKTTSSKHKYTYVECSGNKYTGTYTGDWKDNQPNGDGSFSGKGKNGIISIKGSWLNGKPHKYCLQVITTDAYVTTYRGDFFHGEMTGSGKEQVEDLNGNLFWEYDGEFEDSKYNGSGELTYYYPEEEATELGYYCEIYTGQFADNKLNGEGAQTTCFTTEYAAQYGYEYVAIIATFSDGKITSTEKGALIYRYTQEFGKKNNYDYVKYAGQIGKNGKFIEPYRYTRYKDDKVVEQGRVKNGKYITDEEKIIKDAIYDGVRELAEEDGWGVLVDIFGPAFYDRYGE